MLINHTFITVNTGVPIPASWVGNSPQIIFNCGISHHSVPIFNLKPEEPKAEPKVEAAVVETLVAPEKVEPAVEEAAPKTRRKVAEG